MKKRLILIDDDEMLCNELSSVIRNEKYDLDVFVDSEKGLKSLENNQYDLLLLDLKMPKISGFEILKIAKRRNIPVKIIIITGNPIAKAFEGQDLPGMTDAAKLSAADFIFGKPFDPDALISKIDELIGN